jgi:hypothetical protein
MNIILIFSRVRKSPPGNHSPTSESITISAIHQARQTGSSTEGCLQACMMLCWRAAKVKHWKSTKYRSVSREEVTVLASITFWVVWDRAIESMWSRLGHGHVCQVMHARGKSRRTLPSKVAYALQARRGGECLELKHVLVHGGQGGLGHGELAGDGGRQGDLGAGR